MLHCPIATAHVRRSKLKCMCLGSNTTAGPPHPLIFKKRPVDVLVKTCGAWPQWSVDRGLEAAWRAMLGVERADTRINRKFRKYGRKNPRDIQHFSSYFLVTWPPFMSLSIGRRKYFY